MEVDGSNVCSECSRSTYIGRTILCFTCDRWFHFKCAGVTNKHACVKKKDVPYHCLECLNTEKHKAEKERNRRTSYTQSNTATKKSERAEKSGPVQINVSQIHVQINKNTNNVYQPTMVSNNYNTKKELNDALIKVQKLEEILISKEENEIRHLKEENEIRILKEENQIWQKKCYEYQKAAKDTKKANDKLKEEIKQLKEESQKEVYKAKKIIKLYENEKDTLEKENKILQKKEREKMDRRIKMFKKQQNDIIKGEIKIHNLEETKLEKKHKSDIQSLIKKHQSDLKLQTQKYNELEKQLQALTLYSLERDEKVETLERQVDYQANKQKDNE